MPYFHVGSVARTRLVLTGKTKDPFVAMIVLIGIEQELDVIGASMNALVLEDESEEAARESLMAVFGRVGREVGSWDSWVMEASNRQRLVKALGGKANEEIRCRTRAITQNPIPGEYWIEFALRGK